MVVSRVITAIYEPTFIETSYGFRAKLSADHAIKYSHKILRRGQHSYTVEIDFKSYFNTIPHRRLMKILSQRIKDHRLLRLIVRLLKGGILHQSGQQMTPTIGTPQGGITSPVLANIYLHTVLDQWFRENFKGQHMVRYADDAVFFFSTEEKAKHFLEQLQERVQRYGLTLHPEKTKMLRMNKASKKSFDFLGFTFYWKKSNNRRTLMVKTQKDRLRKAMKEFYKWVKDKRNKIKLQYLWKLAKSKIEGYLNYFGYRINIGSCYKYVQEAKRAMYKWINRRSQKPSYTWEGL